MLRYGELGKILIIVLSLILCACHKSPNANYYPSLQNKLNAVLAHCRSCGLEYSKTHHYCIKAAEQGVYGLREIPDQALRSCR